MGMSLPTLGNRLPNVYLVSERKGRSDTILNLKKEKSYTKFFQQFPAWINLTGIFSYLQNGITSLTDFQMKSLQASRKQCLWPFMTLWGGRFSANFNLLALQWKTYSNSNPVFYRATLIRLCQDTCRNCQPVTILVKFSTNRPLWTAKRIQDVLRLPLFDVYWHLEPVQGSLFISFSIMFFSQDLFLLREYSDKRQV